MIAMRLALTCLIIGVAGCNEKPAQGRPPPPKVTFTNPIVRSVIDWDTYSGYLSSPQTANVAARVSGLIVRSPFREGSMVHQGETLFDIDPRPFQADLDSKKAAVAQAQAQADQAQVHFQRYAKLRGTQAISQDDYDAAKASADATQASLQAAQAAMETSQLNLEWSRVTAPITGRISRIDVTVGNLVNGGAGLATQLTTIVSTDPLYCYVPVPEDAYLKYHTLLELEQQEGQHISKVPCYLDIAGHSPIPGHIDFIDNSVDTNTGTIQVRGVFNNPSGWLIPGLYGGMRIPQDQPHPVLLIPAAAMVVEQSQQSLMVVDDDNVVHNKKVEFGRTFGQLQAVLSGLSADDRVIVNGLQEARPGVKVKPQEAPIPPDDLKALEALDRLPPELPATNPATNPSSATSPATEGAR
jgi:RND family efflux transporter MFP subunit